MDPEYGKCRDTSKVSVYRFLLPYGVIYVHMNS